MPAPFHSFGLSISFNSIDIGGITGVTLPDETVDDVETTASDTSGRHRTYKAGLIEGGNLQVTCRHDPEDSGQQELISSKNNGTVVEVVITFPSDAAAGGTATITFNGYCNAVGGEAPPIEGEAAERTFSIKVASAPTEAVA